MSDLLGVDIGAEILERDILPALFPGGTSIDPTALLVSGQPGSGTRRTVEWLAGASDAGMAVISTDDLRAFHPRSRGTASSSEAARKVASAPSGWVRECLRYARANGFSVALEGAFTDP